MTGETTQTCVASYDRLGLRNPRSEDGTAVAVVVIAVVVIIVVIVVVVLLVSVFCALLLPPRPLGPSSHPVRRPVAADFCDVPKTTLVGGILSSTSR